MPSRTYHREGVFSTTDLPFTGEFDAVFDLTDDEAALIALGAEIAIKDGALVITPVQVNPVEAVQE